jgi:hypothetical protein
MLLEKWVSEKKRLIDQVIKLSNMSFVLLLQNNPFKTSYSINKDNPSVLGPPSF